MRRQFASALTLGILLTAACTDQPQRLPTQPRGAMSMSSLTGVIDQTTGGCLYIPGEAGICVPAQDPANGGTIGKQNWKIERVADGCLTTGTKFSLRTSGPCYHFDSKFVATFNPRAEVVICQNVLGGEAPSLAHRLDNGYVSVTQPLGLTPFLQQVCTEESALLDKRNRPADSGVLYASLQELENFVSSGLDLFRPQPLRAYHLGISGGTTLKSPFESSARGILKALLIDEATGSTPPLNTVQPHMVGLWGKVMATPPGSILVQSSLGDPSLGLPNPEDASAKVVVLSQGGGACKKCGGLELRADVDGFTDPSTSQIRLPSDGLWLLSFQALEDSPTLKTAPFRVRGFVSDANRPLIATVEYTVGKNNLPVIKYNGTDTKVPWVQHQRQRFEILVDLNNFKTSLRINCTAVAGTAFQNTDFMEKATNLRSIGAEFTGIDPGIIGLSHLRITRVPDDGVFNTAACPLVTGEKNPVL